MTVGLFNRKFVGWVRDIAASCKIVRMVRMMLLSYEIG
jgi:hypothetical protein